MKTYWPVSRSTGLVLAAAMLMPHKPSALRRLKSATAQTSSVTAVAKVDVDRVDQQTIVRIQGDGALKYHVTRLSDPPRVVIDFDEARLAAPRNTTPATMIQCVVCVWANPKPIRCAW